MQMKLSNYDAGTGGPAMHDVATKLDIALKTITTNVPNLNFTYRDVQPYYKELYLTAICLEIGGAMGLIAGWDVGAYALVRMLLAPKLCGCSQSLPVSNLGLISVDASRVGTTCTHASLDPSALCRYLSLCPRRL